MPLALVPVVPRYAAAQRPQVAGGGALGRARVGQDLCLLEQGEVEQGSVGTLDPGVPERQLSDEGPAAQHPGDRGCRPRCGSRRRQPVGLEPLGDGLGAAQVAGVLLEDALDDTERGGSASTTPWVSTRRPKPTWEVSGSPLASLASMPAMTRSTIRPRSNSANEPSICSTLRPMGVPVSMGSVTEAKRTECRSRRSVSACRRAGGTSGRPCRPRRRRACRRRRSRAAAATGGRPSMARTCWAQVVPQPGTGGLRRHQGMATLTWSSPSSTIHFQ